MARSWELIQAYFENGAFFALLHGVLAVWTLVEIRAFKNWSPRSGSWEELEARSDYIRGIIGLFLVVGVAGTFFGLYEVFEGNPADGQIGARLQRASAKAFPVGFMGLMLSLFFSAWADLLQKGKARVLEGLRSSTLTLEELIKLSNRRLEAIETSLGPVARLETTLSDSLQPVIRELGGSLDRAREILEDQGKRLEEGKDALIQSSGRLEESAKKISKAVQGLSRVADATEQVLTFVSGIEDRSAKVFSTAASQIEVSTNSVVAVGERAGIAMTAAGQGLGEALKAIPPAATEVVSLLRAQSLEASEMWRGLFADASGLADNLNASLRAAEAAHSKLEKDLPMALQALLAQVTQAALSEAQSTFASLQQSLEGLRKDVREDSIEITNATQMLDRIVKLALEGIEPRMKALTEAYSETYRDFLFQMAELAGNMEKATTSLSILARRYGEQVEILERSGQSVSPLGPQTPRMKHEGYRGDVTIRPETQPPTNRSTSVLGTPDLARRQAAWGQSRGLAQPPTSVDTFSRGLSDEGVGTHRSTRNLTPSPNPIHSDLEFVVPPDVRKRGFLGRISSRLGRVIGSIFGRR